MLSERLLVSGVVESSVNADRLGCSESLVMPSVRECDAVAVRSSKIDPAQVDREIGSGIRSLRMSVLAYENVIRDHEREFKELSAAPNWQRHVASEYRADAAFLQQQLELRRAELADNHGVHDQGQSIAVWAPYRSCAVVAEGNEAETLAAMREAEPQASAARPTSDTSLKYPRASRRARRELADVAS